MALSFQGSKFAFSLGMKPIMRIFLVLSILTATQVSMAASVDAPMRPLSTNSTLTFGNTAPEGGLAKDGFRLLCWNIYKGSFPQLPDDFAHLSFGADLALVQEMVSAPGFVFKLLGANPKFSWTMVKAFSLGDGFTGVATGSRVRPLYEEGVVSEVTEPISATPKTIMISTFAIQDSEQTLMVANIHGINFVTRETYKTHIRQLLDKVRDHKGPLVIAGDFNTWGDGRFEYLQKAFAPLGLKLIATPTHGYLHLDHIFARGLKARYAFDLGDVKSSDHSPLMVDLVFE